MDADHPEKGVLIPRRFTSMALCRSLAADVERMLRKTEGSANADTQKVG